MRQWSLADRGTPAKDHFKSSTDLIVTCSSKLLVYCISLLFKVLFSNLKRLWKRILIAADCECMTRGQVCLIQKSC